MAEAKRKGAEERGIRTEGKGERRRKGQREDEARGREGAEEGGVRTERKGENIRGGDRQCKEQKEWAGKASEGVRGESKGKGQGEKE